MLTVTGDKKKPTHAYQMPSQQHAEIRSKSVTMTAWQTAPVRQTELQLGWLACPQCRQLWVSAVVQKRGSVNIHFSKFQNLEFSSSIWV